METTTTTDTTKATAAATVLQRSVCLMLRTSGIGNERNVNLSAIELKKRKLDGADETIQHKDEYRLSQQLVDKKVLAPARSAVDGVKRWLGGVATRSHRVFGPGTYLIAIPDLEMVEARLEQFRDDIHALGAKLAAEWDAEVEKRKELLGPTFNAADYVTAVEVMDAFDIDWSYVSFAAPDKLEDVSHVLASKANQKYQAKLAAAFDEILLDLRGDALRIMRELVDRLKPGLDGKPKALRETALRDLQDYLARLPNRNTGHHARGRDGDVGQGGAVKLSKQERTQRATHSDMLRTRRAEVMAGLADANRDVAAIVTRLNGRIADYNLAAGEAAVFVKGVADDLEERVDGKTDAWKEGDAGQAATAMAEAWREADDPDLITPAVLPDIELDVIQWQWMDEQLRELPEESES